MSRLAERHSCVCTRYEDLVLVTYLRLWEAGGLVQHECAVPYLSARYLHDSYKR